MPVKRRVKWLKRIVIALAVLLAVALALPFLIPLDKYIPLVEREASAALKAPVTIKKLRVSLVPLPHVTIDGITVGTAGDINVGAVTVTPDLWSLLQPTKVIRSIEIDSLVLTQKGIDRAAAAGGAGEAKSTAPAPPPVRIESIRVSNALVKLEKLTFGPFDARVRLSSKGEPEEGAIVTRDGKLKASVTPEKSQFVIDATAKSWQAPVGPAILFDELAVKGTATRNGADFSHVSAKLYGGTVNGKGTAGWQKGVQLKGSLDISQVELKEIVPLLSPGTRVSGRLSAKPVFSAQAASAQQVVNALRLETPFNVQNGVLYGVDIEKAALSLVKRDVTGGETKFDQLAGHLVMDRGSYRFTGLKIASGALAADGNVNISSQKELSGRVNAQVKAMQIAAASIPLNVSGTVAHPILLPTGGTLAGAAAGTAILGPGIGTSLGVKAGQFVEGLFGRKSDDPQQKK